MAQNTDIQVRLSAQGVDEVVNALKRVQNQAQQTGKSAGKGMGLLNEALGDLQGLLPQLGVAGVVGGFAVLTKQALESADAIGKLSQKSGISTETLSALKLAGNLADVSFEQLSKGLVKFNKSMGELDEGSSGAAASVRRLFGSSGALNGLDTEQRLLKVATAIGKLPSGFQKTKAAMDFFGKSGADLIPLLDDLSEQGLAKFMQRARELGVIVDKDLAKAAQVANDNIKELKIAAEGAATQFAAGLAPAIADSAKALTEATTGEGVDGLKKVGEAVGWVAKGIVSAFIVVGETIGLRVAEGVEIALAAFDALGKGWEATFAFIRGDTTKAKDALASIWTGAKESMARIKAMNSSGNENLLNRLDKIWNPPTEEERKKGKGKGGKAPTPETDKARLEAARAQLDQELALSQKYLDLDQQRNQRKYDQQLIDLQKYFDDRKAIVLTESANEIATLEQQRAKLKASPLGITQGESDDQINAKKIKRKQELDALDAKIDQAKLDRTKKGEEEDEKKRKAIEDLGKRQLEIEAQILEAQGKTYEAAQIRIRIQANELKKSLGKGSEGQVAGLTGALTNQADYAEFQKGISESQAKLNLTQANLQNQVEAGQIYPFEAAQKYKEAVDALVPSLISQLQTVRDLESTTPEQKDQIDQQIVSLNQTQIAAGNAAQGFGSFKKAAQDAVTSDLTNFFTTGIEQADNFADAMRGLALSVVDSLKQIAAQMLATYLMQKLLGSAVKGGEGGGWVGAIAGLFAAEGGYISGPGSGTSDSIPARLSNGEFVVNAASVRQPGILPLLDSINSGMGRPSLRTRGGVPGFAEGGMVTAQDAMAQGLSVDASFGVDEGVIVRQALVALKSKDGQRAIIENIGKNQKATSRALGRS